MAYKKVIINADDFGLTESCTKAIADAYRKRLVSDMSMVANGEAFELAVRLYKEDISSVGIHFNLTEGKPLTERMRRNKRFVNGGMFNGIFRQNQAYFMYISDNDKKDIIAELEAQIKRIYQSGVRISHADSHQHIHYRFTLAPLILGVCKRYGIRKIRKMKNIGFSSKKHIKKFISSKYNSYLQGQGFICTDYFQNIHNYSLIPDGCSEMMIHPDYDNAGRLIDKRFVRFLDAKSGKAKERYRLLENYVYEKIGGEGGRMLITYEDLLNGKNDDEENCKND